MLLLMRQTQLEEAKSPMALVWPRMRASVPQAFLRIPSIMMLVVVVMVVVVMVMVVVLVMVVMVAVMMVIVMTAVTATQCLRTFCDCRSDVGTLSSWRNVLCVMHCHTRCCHVQR